MDDIINKVVSKTIHVRVYNKSYYVKKYISPELYQLANDRRVSFIKKNRFSGFLSMQQARFHLIKTELIPFDYENRLNKMTDDIELLKVELYKARHDNNATESIRRNIKKLRLMHASLFLKTRSLDSASLEGMAEDFMNEYIALRLINKKLPYFTLLKIMRKYEESIPGANDVRQMCKFPKWRGLWVSKGTELFSSELDDMQTYAINMSRLYDSIYECPEKPEDFVIQDDDMLDGWLIFNKNEKTSEQRRNEVDRMVPQSAQEVFIQAKNKEDAKRINSLNTDKSIAIKKYRQEMLKSKKLVREIDIKQ